MVTAAVLALLSVAAPGAAADGARTAPDGSTAAGVTLTCALTTPTQIACTGDIASVASGAFTCTAPGPIATPTPGLFTVAPAHCTGTGSIPGFLAGHGTFDGDTVTINTTTGEITVLGGNGTLTMTQSASGTLTCAGDIAVLTATLTVKVLSGSCEGALTMTVPNFDTVHGTLKCSAPATFTVTIAPVGITVPPGGGCTGSLTMTVPGVGTTQISGTTGTLTVTTSLPPVLAIASPDLTVKTILDNGTTETVHCSPVTLDFSRLPAPAIPTPLCTA
ncbi:hypothetical protein [Amycolatopsis balhimycina]|uniref:hypothetical protein n=1 Tax=Amycolatopsis balhimycina TaxID=208443 RepID=UPI000F7936F3|nr:hypothetical protein [Amycolatopsis balhimycina]